jgi:hypothetical protein
MLHQRALAQGRADHGLIENLAGGVQHLRARFQAAIRQRNIGGDNHIARRRAFGDPVVGDIWARFDDDGFDQRIGRYANEAVRHHEDRRLEALRHAIDFILHRAGVGVDIDGGAGGCCGVHVAKRVK